MLAYKEDDWGGVWYHNGAFMDMICIIYVRDGVTGWGLCDVATTPRDMAYETAAERAKHDWSERRKLYRSTYRIRACRVDWLQPRYIHRPMGSSGTVDPLDMRETWGVGMLGFFVYLERTQ
jgi:hypothetical protein